MKDFYKLILVTNRNDIPIDKYLEFIKICATSGITSLQLREKNTDCNFLLNFGKKLKNLLSPLNIPLIINDHIHLAMELDADGVHLGQEDGKPKTARKMLGSNKIIGLSVYTKEQLKIANYLPIDYIGVGAIFNTKSKPNISTIGITKLNDIVSQAKHPVIGIGGINEENASTVIASGASGIAIINAIHSARNPKKTIQKLSKIVFKKGINYGI